MTLLETPFVSPLTHEPLWQTASGTEPRLVTGDGGTEYPFIGDLPDLTHPRDLSPSEERVRGFYDGRVDDYDRYLPLTFKTHREDETAARNRFVDSLSLSQGMRTLDLACGTGRDSVIIAERLGQEGELFLQDLAPQMLTRCIERLRESPVRKHFCVGNAAYLPYRDRFFDAVYSFGGLGEFGDIRRSLQEMVRVTRIGGRVVVGDESIPPWLRGTEFAKILSVTNPQFQAEIPLRDIPIDARNVEVRWVIGGVFYLLAFTVGEGEPQADFDFEIPGPRGGTYRTRYEGQLEGVTSEAKHLAQRARERLGVSMHQWLDRVVREAAARDLTE